MALGDRVCVAATFADYDNDGRPDLFVTSTRGGNVLFHNHGDGRFQDVTKEAGLTLWAIADRRFLRLRQRWLARLARDEPPNGPVLGRCTAHYYLGLGNIWALPPVPRKPTSSITTMATARSAMTAT